MSHCRVVKIKPQIELASSVYTKVDREVISYFGEATFFLGAIVLYMHAISHFDINLDSHDCTIVYWSVSRCVKRILLLKLMEGFLRK